MDSKIDIFNGNNILHREALLESEGKNSRAISPSGEASATTVEQIIKKLSTDLNYGLTSTEAIFRFHMF